MGSFYAMTTRINYLRTQKNYLKITINNSWLFIILGSALKVILYHTTVYIYETSLYNVFVSVPICLDSMNRENMTFMYDIP